MKITEYLKHLNSDNWNLKEYLEVAKLEYKSIKCSQNEKGFLDGLQLTWSNGIST